MDRAAAFDEAERRLFERYGLTVKRGTLALRDPPTAIGVRECGDGAPVVFVHGSGMSGPTWAPVLAHLPDRRCIAIDLPGFGRSAPYSYTGRTLREHAVAQLSSALDALGLDRAPLVTPASRFGLETPGSRTRGGSPRRVTVPAPDPGRNSLWYGRSCSHPPPVDLFCRKSHRSCWRPSLLEPVDR